MDGQLNCALVVVLCLCILPDLIRSNDAGRSAAPIIKIRQGALQGAIAKSRSGQEYFAYWGIHYAKPPARFQPPEPAPIPSWEGLRDARIPGPICVQKDFFTGQPVTGSEDCLFVNVFTRHVGSQDELRPVIVYIHDGAFYNGAGQYRGANYFMDEPVVLVTFNYRLAALGFLNIGEWSDTNETNDASFHPRQEYDGVANGNMGLKDQVMVLSWVQDNIEAFGGDKARVTIFGTSAGGASVSYHQLSPISAGLFHRAIAASGSALNPWAFSRNPDYWAKKLGESLKCPTSDSNELIQCLLTKDAAEIFEKSVITTVWPLDPVAAFLPSVESRISPDEAFLTEHPKTMMKKGVRNKVPLMTGVAKNEGLFLHAGRVLKDPALTKALDDNWKVIAPVTFKLQGEILDTNMDEATKAIRSFYLGTKCLRAKEAVQKMGPYTADSNCQFRHNIWSFYHGATRLRPKATVQELEDVYSDRQFTHGVRDTILLHAKHSPVYPYIFEYSDGDTALGSLLFGDAFNFTGKVLHGEDIKYAFDANGRNSPFTVLKDSAGSLEFSKKYVKLLVSFAANGEPNASIFGDEVKWPAVSLKQAIGNEPLEWFHINSPAYNAKEVLTVTTRMEFWDNLLKKYNAI